MANILIIPVGRRLRLEWWKA